jgi:hypothetical protein
MNNIVLFGFSASRSRWAALTVGAFSGDILLTMSSPS